VGTEAAALRTRPSGHESPEPLPPRSIPKAFAKGLSQSLQIDLPGDLEGIVPGQPWPLMRLRELRASAPRILARKDNA
jgi:hypothetical protein